MASGGRRGGVRFGIAGDASGGGGASGAPFDGTGTGLVGDALGGGNSSGGTDRGATGAKPAGSGCGARLAATGEGASARRAVRRPASRPTTASRRGGFGRVSSEDGRSTGMRSVTVPNVRWRISRGMNQGEGDEIDIVGLLRVVAAGATLLKRAIKFLKMVPREIALILYEDADEAEFALAC